jgi:DHA2 family multidrug resistance protein-like MFS transporter
LGPVVGSSILSVASWPWIFAINLPIGVAALAVALRMLPDAPGRARRFDWAGALLNAGFFILLVSGLDKVGDPTARGLAAAEIAAGLALAIVLFRHQASRDAALLPVDLYRIPIFALSSATSICSYAAQTIALIALPFFLQDVLHRSHFEIGLLIAPWPLSVACVARLSGKMADRFPVGILAGAGLGTMCVGLGLLASMPATASALDMLWRVMICGFGFGFFQTPNNRAMMTAGPLHRSGAANGAMAGSRLLGQSLGAAIAAIVFSVARGHATGAAFITAAVIAALGALASVMRQAMSPRDKAPG